MVSRVHVLQNPSHFHQTTWTNGPKSFRNAAPKSSQTHPKIKQYPRIRSKKTSIPQILDFSPYNNVDLWVAFPFSLVRLQGCLTDSLDLWFVQFGSIFPGEFWVSIPCKGMRNMIFFVNGMRIYVSCIHIHIERETRNDSIYPAIVRI